MWFYPLVLMLVVLAMAGGIFLGGVYTLVLVPLAVVAVVSWAGWALYGRAQAGRAGAPTDATDDPPARPLPHQHPRPTGRVATQPETLADARRQQQ